MVHVQLVEAAPRVRCLEPLLMERPYNGNEAENVTTCMDTDANQGGSMHGQHGGHMDSTDHSKSGGASASGQGLYTFDDLLAKVQASLCVTPVPTRLDKSVYNNNTSLQHPNTECCVHACDTGCSLRFARPCVLA